MPCTAGSICCLYALLIFFSFWGLDAIIDRKMDKLKIEPLANPGMEMPGIKTGMPNILAGLPGMRALATKMMHGEMEKLGVPPTREFFQMLSDAGAKDFQRIYFDSPNDSGILTGIVG